MTDLKVWMRAGDQDDYHPFDSPEEAAQDLENLLAFGPRPTTVNRYYGPALVGIEIDETGLQGDNGVSLYWGDDDAQLFAPLSDSELEAFARTLNLKVV